MDNKRTRPGWATIALSILLILGSLEALAEDEVILRRVPGLQALPSAYTMQLLYAALDSTQDEFGPYTLRYSDKEMSRTRTFNEIKEGARVNIVDLPLIDEWEASIIRIPVPIQRGIVSYRLFFVHKNNKDLLANVKTLEELKKIRQGSGHEWSITQALEADNFNIVTGPTKLSLMNMLQAGRFSIYSRGINEVYGELNRYKKSHPDIVLDEHVALYSYLPSYFYVSPKAKRIAERIEKGLRNINEDGTYESLFFKYNEKSLELAQIQKRKVFILNQERDSSELWERDKEYLYTPSIK